MSLNFNFTKVRDHQRVTTNPMAPDEWHPVADALIWLSMICGFREITEKNRAKVALRIAAYQVVCGPYLRRNVGDDKPWQEIFITAADVRRFTGMATNASVMTDAQWAKHLAKLAMDEAGRAKHWTGLGDYPSALSILGEYDPAKEAPTEPAAP